MKPALTIAGPPVPAVSTPRYGYDAAGRRSSRRDIVDGRAFITGFEYDNKGQRD